MYNVFVCMFVDPYVILGELENSKNLQSGNTTMDVVSRILGNAVYAFTRGDYQLFFFLRFGHNDEYLKELV